MDKYTIPSLPSTQHILEDLSDPDVLQIDEHEQPKTTVTEDGLLQKAHVCHQIFKQLEGDIVKQSDLNHKLEELNHKLVENIDNMKKQTKTDKHQHLFNR